MGGPDSRDNEGLGNSASSDPGMGLGQRLLADFSAAAGQVDVKDINNSEKIGWLLSKLHLDQDERDGFFNLLQEQASEQDPDEAFGQWKMLVVTTWAESEKLAKEEEKEKQEKEA